jgi:Uma2 family endonuclease
MEPMRAITADTVWPEQGTWTYEDWLKLPSDGTKYEVLGGVLSMTPAPSTTHQSSSSALAWMLTTFVREHDLGEIFTAPTDVLLPSEPVPVEPDILFIARGREDIVAEARIEGAPDLVVEIVSPSNWPYDRQTKFKLYQLNGIAEYWLVDYRARTIEVFVLEDGEYALLGLWRDGAQATSRVLDGLQVPVSDVFRSVRKR